MNKRALATLVLTAALLGLLLGWVTVGSRAQAETEIRIELPFPPEVVAETGELTATVVITAANLYGYQFVLAFDPSRLEAVAAEFDNTFVNAEFTPPDWSGTIDNIAGTVRFAASQMRPTPPATGSGAVARIRFRAQASPTLPIETYLGLDGVKLADRDGTRLEPVTAEGAGLRIVPFSALEVRVPAPGEILETYEVIAATLVLTCENTYGYQFVVTFDPALLEARDAGFHDAFLNPEYIPPGWAGTIDNVAGTVRFAASQLNPTPPVTGSGAIAWVEFGGKSPAILPATGEVGVTDPRLSSLDGLRMTPVVISGSVTVLPAAVITGVVELQARSDWSGAIATTVPAAAGGVTDASGVYTLTVPAAAYTVSVEMARYLDAERAVTAARGMNALPKVKLLGGDANDDDEVDILDMSIIGGKYDLTVNPLTERADINADGLVDIIDIVVAAGNYTRTSPVPWP